jgi:hypothetical protein
MAGVAKRRVVLMPDQRIDCITRRVSTRFLGSG